MKLDLHLHSTYSRDATATPKEIVKQAIAKGLDGIAIVDHNSVRGGLNAMRYAPSHFIVIPGAEISTAEGHLLALGVTEDIPRGLSLEETVEKVNDLGGLGVVAHPYRWFSGVQPKGLPKGCDIETLNARCSSRANKKAGKLANTLGVGRTGGSDAHLLEEVGNAVTLFDNTSRNVDDLLADIAHGKTNPSGQSATYRTIASHCWSGFLIWLKYKGKRV